MNPFLVFVSEHIGLLLAVGVVAGVALTVVGTVAAWRTGRCLRTPERSYLRFALSLLLVVAGLGVGLFFGSGVVAMGPGLLAQSGMIGELAPDVSFAYVDDDRPGRLADYRGQVVLLNVWATWCPPCVREMPELERLAAEHGDSGLAVLHLSDEDRDTIATWLESHPVGSVHLYAQPLPLPEAGRPTSYVVDREGVVREVIVGNRSFEQFERAVAGYL